MRIKIKGEQYSLDEELVDEITLITEAKVEYKENVYIIDYEESMNNPSTSIKTRLRIYDKRMTMTKFGVISSVMEFDIDKVCESIYATEFGPLDMAVETLKYEYNLDEMGKGNIFLKYKILIADSNPFINILKINLY